MDKNKHISTAEIKRDIADTQFEIEAYEREKEGYELIGDKISMFKAENRRIGIEERKEFIKKLEAILEKRGE